MKPTKKNIIKIAITGPESTGKSTLAKALSEKLNCQWVPEYARTYIDSIERPYDYHDLLFIARGQKSAEAEALKYTTQFLICDTDFLVLKIWSEHKYGKVHPFIIEAYQEKSYDLTLLMDIDLPWQFDPQREHPDERKFFFQWYKNELQRSKVRYHIVSGNEDERLNNAFRYIQRAFNNH